MEVVDKLALALTRFGTHELRLPSFAGRRFLAALLQCPEVAYPNRVDDKGDFPQLGLLNSPFSIRSAQFLVAISFAR